jgi:serine/threonine protein kinase
MTISTLGRYKIVSQLGRGAMGIVYQALDPAIERTVAIKTLNPHLSDENMGEVKERFLREAKSAGRLNHPNVVTIYDVGEAEGVAYISMEFLEGRSLRQLLDAGSALSLKAISDIAAQIADALDYAHRSGIVHRDIKPANIMLSSTGLAKLTDFGIAFMASSSITQTGTMLGSPKYMSPEQVLGQAVDGRSDIFSLGVVLYEMLVRKTPFELQDITTFTLMQRIVNSAAPRVSEQGMDIPALFDAILSHALAKRPEDRFQRAIEFASELRKFSQSVVTALEVITPYREDEPTLPLKQPNSQEETPPQRIVAKGQEETLPPRSDAKEREEMAKLLEGLEAFSYNYEQEEERRRAEEEARRARAEAEAKAKAAAEAAVKAQTDAYRCEQDAAASKQKSALISILHQQAQAKVQERPGQLSRESVEMLNSKLRKAFNYLVEFIRLLNEASPAFNGKLKLLYLGDFPAGTLGNGLVNYRTKRVEDTDAIDYITLNYHVNSTQKARISLNMGEARALKALLERSRIQFTEREQSNQYGKVPLIAMSIDCNISASAFLRADYRAFAVQFECFNVGQIGLANYRISADEFDEETIEEFGKFILGFPSRFAELKQSVGTG